MASAWTRTVPCEDGFVRHRDLRIFIPADSEPRVGIHTPPGDVALLDLAGTRGLQQHVAAAMLEITHRGARVVPERFQQTHQVLSVDDQPRPVGVTAADGHVAFSGGLPWYRLAPDAADRYADSIRAAAAVARQQWRS